MKLIHLPIVASLFVLTIPCAGQSLSEFRLDFSSEASTVEELLGDLNAQIPGTIYCPPALRSLTLPSFATRETTLRELLRDHLTPLGLGVLFHRERIAIVMPLGDLKQQFTSQYYGALEESILAVRANTREELTIGSIDDISLGDESSITGMVRDGETQEAIVGATLLVEGGPEGTVTDTDGYYQLSLVTGSHMLVVQSVGYRMRRLPIKVISNGTLDIALDRSSVLLEEVVVQAQAQDINVQSTQVGVTRMSISEIKKLPSFLGEVDIIKGLLLQPGVSTIGEGSSGFNVRGGNVDQNLIMMDEGMIFNASHALGFFSSFNSDIVSEAILYKGTMPAIYGGRLASALEVKVRDGSFERWHLKGGLGLVSSRVNIDGPLHTGKTSILLSGRSTYADWLLKQMKVPEVRASSAYFYDVNARLTHRFNEKNNLTLAFYGTQDHFSYNEDFGFDYGTLMGQLQFRRVLGAKTLASTNLVWSRYDSDQEDLDGTDMSLYQTGLGYFKAKQNINFLGDMLQANLGASAIHYRVGGNQIEPTSVLSIVTPAQLDDEKALEWALYGDIDLQLSPRLSLIAGLRHTIFHYLGPRNTFIYRDADRPSIDGLLEPIRLEDNIIETHQHLQPRVSLRYKVSPTGSIKAGYGRTAQYINQIFNSETPTPTSFWQLSNQYILPQLAHNFSLGFFQNFSDNLWETSVEGFYRDITQLFDYREFADLLANEHLETELLRGTGRSYGAEVSVRRKIGQLHGWLSYTYSRSERQVPGINRGTWYVSNFDKPHDFNLVTNIQINKRNSISFSFTYGTGRPITVPVSKYVVQNRVVVLNYSERNAFRVPDYHRLDLSYTLAQGFKKSRKIKTSWTLSIYNIYARKNAYSVFVDQASVGNTQIQRLAVLGSAFPSLTFNFELL